MSFNPKSPTARYSAHLSCRVCSTALPPPFFDLGDQPLANNLYSTAAESLNAPRYPLALTRCSNLSCGLVQLTAVVDSELLFGEYLYTPSQSKTFQQHFDQMAYDLSERFRLDVPDLVVDVGSNDGLLLYKFLLSGNVEVLGVEPAANLAYQANIDGITTLNAFFTGETAKQIRNDHGPARLITATNVFAHMNEWHDFCRGVNMLLTDDGVLVIEAPGLLEMIDQGTFDLIYHEHLNYLALQPLKKLFSMHSLEMFDVQENSIHGGSIRVFVRRKIIENRVWMNGDDRVRGRLLKEAEGITDKSLLALSNRAADLSFNLNETLYAFHPVTGYGAPAKATVLINYCSLTSKDVSMIADDSTLKQGRFIPGTDIAIVAPERAFPHNGNDAALPAAVIFPWNVAGDIIPKLQNRASVAIIPMPEVSVIRLDQESEGNSGKEEEARSEP